MTDADLCRVLAAQLSPGAKTGLVPFAVVEQGAEAIRERLDALAAEGVGHVVVDALDDAHLAALGRACKGMKLVTAGSGLGLALPANFAAEGLLAGGAADALPTVGGPVLLLSGSCSTATNAQTARWEADGGAILRIDPFAVIENPGLVTERMVERIKQCIDGGAPLLISSTQQPDQVARTQEGIGKLRAADMLENIFAGIACAGRKAGIRRFVVAGGETSGAVAKALGAGRLAVGRSIAPGVPWCATLDTEPLALALKSGNFGTETFFADAVEMAP